MEKNKFNGEPNIKGGPFLELSFLIESHIGRRRFIKWFFTEFEKFITLHNSLSLSENYSINSMEKEFDNFTEGYPFDDNDPKEIYIHYVTINQWIMFPEPRKCMIQVEEYYINTYHIDLNFFGAEFDEIEWEQYGITQDDMGKFEKLLIDLCNYFGSEVGTIGYEEDVRSLYPEFSSTPNECYKIQNIDKKSIIHSVNREYLDAHSLVGLYIDGFYYGKN